VQDAFNVAEKIMAGAAGATADRRRCLMDVLKAAALRLVTARARNESGRLLWGNGRPVVQVVR